MLESTGRDGIEEGHNNSVAIVVPSRRGYDMAWVRSMENGISNEGRF